MPALLTPQEKSRIRAHTGYPQVQPAASIQFGLPKPVQVAFILESAMDNLMPEIIPRIRSILDVLDSLEQQIIDAQAYLVADKLEELELAGTGDKDARLVTERLEGEYVRWAERLVDILGVPLYPYSERFKTRVDHRRRPIPVRNG